MQIQDGMGMGCLGLRFYGLKMKPGEVVLTIWLPVNA